jgi:hypothetical protein
VFNDNVSAAAQDAVFTIVKATIPDGHVASFLADAGPVLVRDRCIRKLDIFHDGIVPLDHEDGFLVWDDRGRLEVRELSRAPYDGIARRPQACLVEIRSGIDYHRVARLHQACRIARGLAGAAGTDLDLPGFSDHGHGNQGRYHAEHVLRHTVLS